MQAWWDGLSDIEHILYYIATPATLALLIQTIMTFVGMGGDSDLDAMIGDTDGDFEGEFDSDFEISFQIFTVRNFIAFFTFFSWGALWAISSGKSDNISLVIGIISGGIMMILSASLFYGMKKMTSNGNLNIKNALGKEGQVYLTIPKSKEGVGKIQINVQDSLRELDAMTENTTPIKSREWIKVVGIISDQMVLVESVKDKDILKKDN